MQKLLIVILLGLFVGVGVSLPAGLRNNQESISILASYKGSTVPGGSIHKFVDRDTQASFPTTASQCIPEGVLLGPRRIIIDPLACRLPFWPRMLAIPSTAPTTPTAPQITDIWIYLGRANDGQRVTVEFAILFTDLNGDVNKFIVGCKSSDSGAICAPPETPSPGERSYEVSAKGITKGMIIWEIGCTMDSHTKTSYRFTLADAAGLRSETADWTYFHHWATGTPVRNALPITQCTRLVSLYVKSQ
jgi:hypothetical protein